MENTTPVSVSSFDIIKGVTISNSNYYVRCTTAFLKQAGVTAEKVRLVDRVVLGNGHMMFMETNSEEIVGVTGEWLAKVV